MRLNAFLLLMVSFSGFAQIGGEDEVYLGGDRIDATFQGGGMENFSAFVNKEFDYVKVTQPGKMVGAFTIDEEGNVKNIKIVEFFDIESATEFIRVLKKCPKWVPAKRGGKAISIDIKYPMVFTVKKKEVEESVKETSEIIDESAVESKPKFAGGLSKFYEFIGANFRTPEIAAFKGGRMVVSFVIEKDGSITEIKVVKDIGFGTAHEAIRVLKSCPKWTPAKQNGIPVRCVYALPIKIGRRVGE